MQKRILLAMVILTLLIPATILPAEANFQGLQKNEHKMVLENSEEQTFERNHALIATLTIENPTSVKYIKLTKLLYLNIKIEGGKVGSPSIRLFKSWWDFWIWKGEYGQILDIDFGKTIKTIEIPIILLQDDLLGDFQYIKNPDGTSLIKIQMYGALHPKIIWES